MAWKYAAFSAMCPECTLDETAALASSVGIDGLEWRVTKKAPEPITEVSHWGVNRSTVDVNDIEADLKRAKEIADQRGLELRGPYLSHVHAKNCLWEKTGEKDGVAEWEWRMAPVKKGQADWTTIVAALKKVGYDGWLSFEDFSDGDTKTKMTEALAYLKKLEAG